jgi:xanthine dehydrogenase accessory factor
LDIQARSPEEIALSILAEIVQVRRNLEIIEWQPAAALSSPNPTSLDPVCGMSVQTAAAKVTHEHAGEVYYFCCVGCREKFAADPKAY